MEKELKTLSDRIAYDIGDVIYVEDVKEFIKKLKERVSFVMNNSDYTEDDIMKVIDKIFGKKLTK